MITMQKINLFKEALQKTADDFGLKIEPDSLVLDGDKKAFVEAWKDATIKTEIIVEERAWDGGLYVSINMARDFSELKVKVL